MSLDHGHGGHNNHNHFHFTDENYGKLVRFATLSSMVFVSIIIAIKIIGWFVTDSLSLLASLADSFLDIAASFINFIAIRYALKPPDDNHRFGHQKAEDIAVFIQSCFFIVSAIFITVQAVKRMAHHEQIEYNDIGIWVMVISTLLTAGLIAIQLYVIKKTDSMVVRSDYMHYVIDFTSNLLVLISFYTTKLFNNQLIDPVIAIFIAIYIFVGSLKALKRSFNNLTDREFDQKQKDLLEKIIMSHEKAKGVHDIKTRYAGSKPFIQFHLELDGNTTLYDAHYIAEEVEQKIMVGFPGADVIIHQDPVELYKDN